MRKEWFEKLVLLDKARKEDVIQAEDLSPYVYDKTLIYGYTCERLTFHVYIKNRKIYTVVYNTDSSTGRAKPIDMRLITVTSNKDYIPDKRIYPERCEYHFCKMLQDRGVELPFTTFDEENIVLDGKYYGFTLDDLLEN